MAEAGYVYFKKLPNVHGRDHISNTIYFSGTKGVPKTNLIFFGGDVQNEEELMSNHRINQRYIKWSLDAVSRLFIDRLPTEAGVHIWIVLASRWTSSQTFACYDNFVCSSSSYTGVPDFSGVHGFGRTSSWFHLDRLLRNAVNCVNTESSALASSDLPCCLVGFSKGGCVITQLLYELGVFVDLPTFLEIPLVSRVFSMTWLDAGHNGQSHLWPTWTWAISRLKWFPFTIPTLHVYATPYELCDENRPWNRRDFNTFLKLLQTYQITYCMDIFFNGKHWAYEPDSYTAANHVDADIEVHFDILTAFPIELCVDQLQPHPTSTISSLSMQSAQKN